MELLVGLAYARRIRESTSSRDPEKHMSVVAKFFIQSRTESPDGSSSYQLGAVCRGDENKEWSAATPSGSMKVGNSDLLDGLWPEPGPSEVFVHINPDLAGEWVFDKCDFTYGGCAVKFRQKDSPWGTLEMSINATEATRVLREAFAESLIKGEPARFSVEFA